MSGLFSAFAAALATPSNSGRAVARARAGSSTAAEVWLARTAGLAAIPSSPVLCSGRSAAAGLAVVLDVTPEGPRGGELPQLVADHRVGHEDRHVLAAVVHRDRVADHVRDDGGPAGPRPDHGLLARLVEGVHLLEQVVVHEGALLQAARHALDLPALLSATSLATSLAKSL